MEVFMAVYFTGANSNSDITSGRENGKLFNMDCTVIILEALGIEVPKYFDAISPYISYEQPTYVKISNENENENAQFDLLITPLLGKQITLTENTQIFLSYNESEDYRKMKNIP
ncbi:3036_t:CDS:2 [Racocetra fulgida]|uniref:3036_t:CDS:1 n=1 Tax=Racocetra fulgida TaxID=60492 RepID=A0A9N8W284_9GLOM|nr:3036_t:CDS:2 [Racocetra fulgida]